MKKQTIIYRYNYHMLSKIPNPDVHGPISYQTHWYTTYQDALKEIYNEVEDFKGGEIPEGLKERLSLITDILIEEV